MEFKDLCNVGSDIMDAVTEAVEKNDYSDLSSKIQGRVSGFTDELRQDTAEKLKEVRNEASSRQSRESYRRKDVDYGRYRQMAEENRMRRREAASQNRNTPFFQKRVSRFSGLGKMISGITGTFLFGLFCLGFVGAMEFLVHAAVLTGVLIGGAAVTGGMALLSVAAAVSGRRRLKLVDKYYEYGRVLGNLEYCTIEDLARKAGKTKDSTYQDLQKMQKAGLLPQIRYDEGRTTLMLTDTVYQQYLSTEQEHREREAKEKEILDNTGSSADSAEIREILQEGENYLNTIRTCNELIPDDQMSDKLSNLEHIMNRIFEQVKKQPKTAQNLRKFMNYYLPTTVKLLHAYIDLDKQPQIGENITKTKKEIEETLDTINAAFEKLLDSLFEDMAWDISADISVMKTMMAQDGLTK